MITRVNTEKTTEGSIRHWPAEDLSTEWQKRKEASSVSDVSTSHHTEKWPELTLQLHIHLFYLYSELISCYELNLLIYSIYVNKVGNNYCISIKTLVWWTQTRVMDEWNFTFLCVKEQYAQAGWSIARFSWAQQRTGIHLHVTAFSLYG